jgi:lantibiotic modifying enzyme
MKKKSSKRLRYIPNNYNLNSIDINAEMKEIYSNIELCEKNSSVYYPPNMSKSINSLGKEKTKPTFYTGTGGNIYIYWKQYLFYDKKKEYLDKFYLSLKTNLSIREEIGEEESTNSFFMGDSGIYMFYCIYALEIKNEELFDKFFDKLIKLKTISENKYAEVELLYGTSGYLYSLLFLKKYLIKNSVNGIVKSIHTKNLDNSIKDIFNILLNVGIKSMIKYKWDNSLLYPFPMSGRKEPKFYLGAAHGLIGALYMLLSTIKFFPELSKQQVKINSNNISIENLLINNIKYIQTLQIKSTGNFPSDVEGNDSGDKVHFCHGCIGAVHLFLLAEELYPKNDFKQTALKCNNCLWERGLLYKGNGVCHGMSGVIYGLIKLYKFTKDELYLKEAVGICHGTFDPEVQKLVKQYEDPQRYSVGIPDTPYSLMEGEGGCLVMYYDLIKIILNKDNKDKDDIWGIFPGYEIF